MKTFVVILFALGAASAMPLGYQKGQRYTYNYQSDVTHAIPSGSAKTLGLRLKCQAHLDVLMKNEYQITLENIQVHQVFGSLKDPKQQQEKAADPKVTAIMQQRLALPVRAVLRTQDGSIKEVNANPKDDEWSLNIKRGLVNLFQISPRVDKEEEQQFVTQHETTAVGDCQVSYVIQRDNSQSDQKQHVTKVSKVINYEKCQNQPEFLQHTFNAQKCQDGCEQSVSFAPYHRSIGQIEHTLRGSAKTGYLIYRTEAVEQHVITPFSRSDGQVTASARQTLEYKKQDKAGQAATALTKKTSHRLVAENFDERARQDAQWQAEMARQAEVTANDMCEAARQWQGQKAAEKFTALVQQLRQCSKDTLGKLADKMLSREDPSERKFCIDAISFVGTPEAAQVLKAKIDEKKINRPDEIKRAFLGLASVSRPTADHIDTCWELCNHAEVAKDMSARRECMLTFGALVHKINQSPKRQQDTKAKAACQQYVQEILQRLANKQTSQEEKVMYIKAIGNAASAEAREQLHKILKDKAQPLHIRVQCVWALRRIIYVAREEATSRLVSIFADAKESPELRMGVFLLLLNSEPNLATLQACAGVVEREINDPTPGPRSNQVASYVVSHLSALAYQNNVLTNKRSKQARQILRLMPKMSFGLGYSKGMRMAYNSEKFQAGFEFESNKMAVPDSMLPRNMNARILLNFMGYKTSALEFGARIENMDDVIEQVVTEVRNRHKRSLWGNVLSWLYEENVKAKFIDGEDSDDKNPTGRLTQPSTKHTSFTGARRRSNKASTRPSARSSTRLTAQPTGSQRPSTQQRSTFPSSDGQSKSQRLSAYMKLFGDEVKFMEIKQENIKQFAQDIADILQGKKERVEYLDKGIVITKKGVEVMQRLEKAFQLANARRMVQTLAGIPLDLQYRSAAVVKVIAAAKMEVEPSITSLFKLEQLKLKSTAQIMPSIGAHQQAQIGIHTPFLRMGLQVKSSAHSNPEQKVDVDFEAGKEYKINYNLPKEQCDILNMKSNAQGFAEETNPLSGRTTQQQISMDFKTPHLKMLEKTCKGQNPFGVQLCVEGQVPDLPALRLEQVQAFPTIALTELRVSMAPASDKPTAVQWNHQLTSDDKEIQVQGSIDASSQSVTRQTSYTITYTRDKQQLQIELQKMQAPEYEDSKMKCTVNREEGLKLQFGRQQLQYQVSAFGQVQNQGKTCCLRVEWTEIPEQWKQFFYNWGPQIWHFLQQFAWVRRPKQQQAKQVQVEFVLTSPMTARLRVQTPDAIAERTDLSLPVRVDRLPSSLQEIKNYFYAQCEVQDSSIKVFDQLQYKHNIKGGCPYVLTQDHRQGKQTRIQLTVKIDQQGQKTLAANIQQPSQESVVIKSDSTILVDGQQMDCSQKACQSKQGEATVRKVQQADGKTQIQLSTKLGLHATVEGQRIQVYVSPLLRGRVRGLCGDADGEQWNEYKDPKDRVQELKKFIQSWQQQC